MAEQRIDLIDAEITRLTELRQRLALRVAAIRAVAGIDDRLDASSRTGV
ncbi:hypothetical protein [Streptomyces flavofungini]|uniref:Chorismate mutase n=1 Tax=Streptomyces flavofungini TaxID=68200 RepID=A0ABS0X293_9ACTN|nr:hypothetical protein [Streptomyces flavofungini]MBJ3807310.1 hypothetical protein [Streptomyces flavofungini]GHC58504.1 hypothetical protein GCM10010349_27000 [Streptomyces flavofungini]